MPASSPIKPPNRLSPQARLEFLRGYRDLPGGQPAVWNFSLLAFPGAVLSAIRCSFASQNSINPSAVGFRTEVVKPTSEFPEPVEPPSSGIYLGGLHLQVRARHALAAPCGGFSHPRTSSPLNPPSCRCARCRFLQGAAWDAETISLARLRDGVLFSPMPPVWVIPVHRAALQLDDPKRARTTFDCPVVLTPDNADIPNSSVLLLRMPTRLPPEELLRARVSSVVSPFGTARTTGAPPP